MSRFEFFYADINANLALLNDYPIDDWIHANNGVVASRLRGGLLTNCNIRFSFLPIPQSNFYYRQEDQDYRNQQLFIFDGDLNFRVLDKFQIGDKAQILMSPINEIEVYGLDAIIREARADFQLLFNTRPVPVLDTPEWRRKVATVPGVDSKNDSKKGFRTEWWK